MVFLQMHLNILINQNQIFQTMTKNVGLFIGHCNQVSAWVPYLLEIDAKMVFHRMYGSDVWWR